MRKIYINTLVLVASLLGLGSCTFLDTESPSTFTPTIVYEDKGLVEMALLGVYSQLSIEAVYTQYVPVVFNSGSDIEIRSFSKNQADQDNRAAAHYLAKKNNSQLDKMVLALFSGVEQANKLIEGVEGSSLYASGDAEMKKFHGEAVALRALFYRDLIRNLGDVPFKLTSTNPDGSNIRTPKKDRFEVLEVLIDNLLQYADELPWTHSSPERISQGFARGLAAQFALMRAGWSYSTEGAWVAPLGDAKDYYGIARDQSELVITQGGFSLTTGDDKRSAYEKYWYDMCQRRINSNENLFDVGMCLGKTSELAYTVGPRVSTATDSYGYPTQGQLFTTAEYYYSFHPEDTRRDVSAYCTEYRDISSTTEFANAVLSKTGISENLISNAQQFRIGKWDPTWLPKDWIAGSLEAKTKYCTGINYCMMRYAEVLLMFAEADYALDGATAAAKDALWQVRSRAIPTMTSGDFAAYLGTKDFMKAIEDERRWEFCGEGVRKWDLLRWGKLAEAITQMRKVNADLVLNWSYQFEFPTRKLASGEVVTRTLPKEVYYKYDGDNMLIEDINLDYDRARPAGKEYFSTTDGKIWIYVGTNQKVTTAEEYRTYLNQTASGLVSEDGSLVMNGRPFQPIPQSMIDAYDGALDQDYGF